MLHSPRRLALATVCLAAASLAAGCGRKPPAVDVPVTLQGVLLDPATNSPVLLLEEKGGKRRLPIWIGLEEARSIAQRLEKIEPPRPNAHDLMQRVFEGLDIEVARVTVTELRGSTYYAVLAIRSDARTLEIDARPSDAIAIALRTGAPLFVREEVFRASQGEPTTAAPEQQARGSGTPDGVRNGPATVATGSGNRSAFRTALAPGDPGPFRVGRPWPAHLVGNPVQAPETPR